MVTLERRRFNGPNENKEHTVKNEIHYDARDWRARRISAVIMSYMSRTSDSHRLLVTFPPGSSYQNWIQGPGRTSRALSRNSLWFAAPASLMNRTTNNAGSTAPTSACQ